MRRDAYRSRSSQNTKNSEKARVLVRPAPPFSSPAVTIHSQPRRRATEIASLADDQPRNEGSVPLRRHVTTPNTCDVHNHRTQGTDGLGPMELRSAKQQCIRLLDGTATLAMLVLSLLTHGRLHLYQIMRRIQNTVHN